MRRIIPEWPGHCARCDHYMGADMLQSQFEDLEPPAAQEAIVISIDDSVETIVESIVSALGV